jgi:hypothetical protein
MPDSRILMYILSFGHHLEQNSKYLHLLSSPIAERETNYFQFPILELSCYLSKCFTVNCIFTEILLVAEAIVSTWKAHVREWMFKCHM